MVESFVDFEREVSVIAVKGEDEIATFPIGENIHEDEILRETVVPARSSEAVTERAHAVARDVLEVMDGRGVYGIELFETREGEILLNEIAPRPHNSGHWTIEGAQSSQFEHTRARAVLGWPLGSTELRSPTVLTNLLADVDEERRAELSDIDHVLETPAAHLHWYGKRQARPLRKMGHVTVSGETEDADVEALLEVARPRGACDVPDVASRLRVVPLARSVCHCFKSLARPPPAMSDSVSELIERLDREAEQDRPSEETPDVGIVMGSDSDLETMMTGGTRRGAYDAFVEELGFAEQTDFENPPAERFTFETYVTSAHRTPDLMTTYAETAEERGLDVIIAGAGGKSADPPNMTASIAYPLPVIGVPVQEKSVDSVIGMPTGAPLVAVDAGKSFNAALSAAQILARQHESVRDRLVAYHEDLREGVGDVSRELHDSGTPAFRDRDR